MHFHVFGPLKRAIRWVNFSTHKEVKNCGAFIVVRANPKQFFLSTGIKSWLQFGPTALKNGNRVKILRAYVYVSLVMYVVWNNALIS